LKYDLHVVYSTTRTVFFVSVISATLGLLMIIPIFAENPFGEGTPYDCSIQPTRATLEECLKINPSLYQKASNCGKEAHPHKGLSVCVNNGVDGTPNNNPNNNCGLGTLEDPYGVCQLFPGDCGKHIEHDENGIPLEECPDKIQLKTPKWFEKVLTWYSEDKILDVDLYNTMKFLIQKKIISVETI